MEEERLQSIRELVRSTYQDPRVVARYAEVGLWPAEETLILEYVTDDAVVLDVGCGAGRTSVPLREMGFSVTAIDLSSTMVELAKEVGQACQVDIDYRVMDVMDLNWHHQRLSLFSFPTTGLNCCPGVPVKSGHCVKSFEFSNRVGTSYFSSHSPFA